MTAQRIALLSLTALLLVGCASQPIPDGGDAPGFFSGIWHGLILPFSFIASIFTDARIYAFPNTGGWYDFGFVIGVATMMGSGSRAGR